MQSATLCFYDNCLVFKNRGGKYNFCTQAISIIDRAREFFCLTRECISSDNEKANVKYFLNIELYFLSQVLFEMKQSHFQVSFMNFNLIEGDQSLLRLLKFVLKYYINYRNTMEP